MLAALAFAAPTRAQTATAAPGSSTAVAPTQQTLPGGLVRPGRTDVAPVGRRLSAQQVLAIADRVPKVQEAVRKHPGSTKEAFLKGPGRWQVSYIVDRDGERTEIAQVLVDDLSGTVIEAWTGYQVPWTMARGYDGAFGRGVNSPWVWIPLCILFVVPFVDVRNPWRMLHLDLLVLAGFSVALAFFNDARVGISTPRWSRCSSTCSSGCSGSGGRAATRATAGPPAAAPPGAGLLAGDRRRVPRRLPDRARTSPTRTSSTSATPASSGPST